MVSYHSLILVGSMIALLSSAAPLTSTKTSLNLTQIQNTPLVQDYPQLVLPPSDLDFRTYPPCLTGTLDPSRMQPVQTGPFAATNTGPIPALRIPETFEEIHQKEMADQLEQMGITPEELKTIEENGTSREELLHQITEYEDANALDIGDIILGTLDEAADFILDPLEIFSDIFE